MAGGTNSRAGIIRASKAKLASFEYLCCKVVGLNVSPDVLTKMKVAAGQLGVWKLAARLLLRHFFARMLLGAPPQTPAGNYKKNYKKPTGSFRNTAHGR